MNEPLLTGAAPRVSALRRVEGARYTTVYAPLAAEGASRFLHGVSVAEYGGRLYLAFGYNTGAENSAAETLMYLTSDDFGATWSAPTAVEKPDETLALSHGVFWKTQGGLLLAAPQFGGLGEPEYTEKGEKLIVFRGLRTVFFRLDEAAGRFVPAPGVIADFWPLGAPEEMPDGSVLIPGCTGRWLGAVARRGKGERAWRTALLDTGGHAYTEANLLAWGDKAVAVLRNQSPLAPGETRFGAAAVSVDCGKRFAPCGLSALPMNASKPCAGRLQNGRPYLIYNASDANTLERRRLVLALGPAGGFSFDRFSLLDEDLEEGWVCYPYACEANGFLLVGYSRQSRGAQKNGEPRMNRNDAVLAMIPLKEVDPA